MVASASMVILVQNVVVFHMLCEVSQQMLLPNDKSFGFIKLGSVIAPVNVRRYVGEPLVDVVFIFLNFVNSGSIGSRSVFDIVNILSLFSMFETPGLSN